MNQPDDPSPPQEIPPSNLVAANPPESAGDLRAYLRLELAAAFERRLTSATKLPEAQRQSLTQLVRNESVTVEAILGELRLRHTERSE